MKKTLIILLIVSIGIIDIIKPIYLSIWQMNWRKQIRRELKSEVKKNHLITLTFSKCDLLSKRIILQFIKEDEFRYNGSMYDIVVKSESNDSITYVCFLDLKEMLQIASIINCQLHSGLLSPILPILKSIISQNTYYLLTKQIFVFYPNLFLVLHTLNSFKYPRRIIDVATPPPKMIIIN